jgi:ribosomal protein S18 acetylase RimI-like enzyme
MSDLILRRAAPSDARLVLDLIEAAFAEYRGKLVPESGAYGETPEGIAAQLVGGQGAIIAERDGVAVGCVLYREKGEDLYFGRLSVLPDHRRSGVAEALVAAVEAEGRVRGASGVSLGVRIALTGNQRLFARLGYVEISREAHPGFTEPTSINMRKALR